MYVSAGVPRSDIGDTKDAINVMATGMLYTLRSASRNLQNNKEVHFMNYDL